MRVGLGEPDLNHEKNITSSTDTEYIEIKVHRGIGHKYASPGGCSGLVVKMLGL